MENVVKFAEYLMKKYPRADLYPYRSWTYPQGFLLWGYIRLYEKTGREDFYNYILAYCQEHVNEDGELLFPDSRCIIDDWDAQMPVFPTRHLCSWLRKNRGQ